jgi:transcriptional regulator with XRE-family HTH domain
MKNTSERVRANVKVLRDEKGMRLADLSERLKKLGHPMSVNTLSKIEQGNRGIDVDDLEALAEAFEIPPSRLLADPDLVSAQALAIADLLEQYGAATYEQAGAQQRLEEQAHMQLVYEAEVARAETKVEAVRSSLRKFVRSDEDRELLIRVVKRRWPNAHAHIRQDILGMLPKKEAK